MNGHQTQNPLLNLLQLVKRWLSGLAAWFSAPKRPPELAELEARFTREADSDPEKVQNRQFSNTMRSGRG